MGLLACGKASPGLSEYKSTPNETLRLSPAVYFLRTGTQNLLYPWRAALATWMKKQPSHQHDRGRTTEPSPRWEARP